ncbi:hypothetical protein HPP92_023416 [Vanilla planifolia]|uniref:Uncharacterized protein n=1 Tax=Vanilla planifolia TaxID=51239 RepID=A0A835UCU0_VANPL|nr:hypothetical protein HPP92_023416 [Vanilla planifolia]
MTGSMVFKEINIDGDLSVGPPHDVRLRSDSPLDILADSLRSMENKWARMHTAHVAGVSYR